MCCEGSAGSSDLPPGLFCYYAGSFARILPIAVVGGNGTNLYSLFKGASL